MYLRGQLKNNKGLSLIEVLVAMFILAIVTVPALNLLTTGTVLVTGTNRRAQNTYIANAQIESLYSKSYAELFSLAATYKDASGLPTKRLIDAVAGSTKYVIITAVPSGSVDTALLSKDGSGKYIQPVYAHLVINKNNTVIASLVGPDGKYSTISNAMTNLKDAVFTANTADTTYTFKKGGTTLASGTKPANRPCVLIINCVSVTDDINITTNGVLSTQLYKPITMLIPGAKEFTVTPFANLRVYSNDNATPSTVPVTVTCTIYPDGTAAKERAVQTTIEESIR